MNEVTVPCLNSAIFERHTGVPLSGVVLYVCLHNHPATRGGANENLNGIFTLKAKPLERGPPQAAREKADTAALTAITTLLLF